MDDWKFGILNVAIFNEEFEPELCLIRFLKKSV